MGTVGPVRAEVHARSGAFALGALLGATGAAAVARRRGRRAQDRAELERALRSARDTAGAFRSVIDAAPDPIALLDATGTVRVENPAMRRVRLAVERSAGREGFRRAFAVDGSGPALEIRDEVELPGRSALYARYVGPVRDTRGDLVGRLVVLRDVTGEREADRLKDEFFALVSHEFRTPLTSVIGYVELVLDDEQQPVTEEHRHFLSVVDRNATRLLRLVGDLLFAAQVEAGRLQLEVGEIDLAAIARDALEAARPVAEDREIVLAADIAELPRCRGDHDRLGQVLDNLVSNALKFTDVGGTVAIRVAAEGERAVIEVSDSGPGIPPEEQHLLFERFFRATTATSRAIPGVGLGLTIVRAIVEAHDGRVMVRSADGEGATFRVELPLSLPSAGEEEARGGSGVAL